MSAKWLKGGALALVSASMMTGCGDSGGEAGGDPGPGSTGIAQPGAQDFGLFRQILEDGGIPGPEALDDIGFFAEHKLDYPSPDCGQDICMHGLLGVMGNMIEGSTCTLIQVGMNTPIDPETLERPPMHLVVAVDVSGSMGGDPIQFVRAGLHEMVDELEPTDTLTLVAYANWAEVRLDAAPASDPDALHAAVDGLTAGGSTNIHDGLFVALALAETHYASEQQNRVIFLSDGVATSGLQNEPKMVNLAAEYAKLGIGITTIGVGQEFDVELMRDLGEVGAGNFYFLEDPKAVKEVFVDEIATFLYPVALDVNIDVDVAEGYRIRAVYGTNGWEAESDESGRISIPSLFLAGRESSDEPIDDGRRGGGGAMLFELVPDGAGAIDPGAVGQLELSWRHPETGQLVEQLVAVESPVASSGQHFDNETVEKGFVMLNVYAGFDMATRLAADSDLFMARRTLEALRPNVAAWLETTGDPDIADDLHYVDLFIANLLEAEDETVVSVPLDPPNPWPAD